MTRRTTWPPWGVLVHEPDPPVDFRYAEPLERTYCWDGGGDRPLTVVSERVRYRDDPQYYVRIASMAGWRLEVANASHERRSA